MIVRMALVLGAYLPLIQSGTKHYEPYVLITGPNVVEYRGRTRPSSLANYHNLFKDLAIPTGKI